MGVIMSIQSIVMTTYFSDGEQETYTLVDKGELIPHREEFIPKDGVVITKIEFKEY